MKNPISQCNLFDTPTSYDDLLGWCEQLSGGEKIAAITAAHLALNLAHAVVQKTINYQDADSDRKIC